MPHMKHYQTIADMQSELQKAYTYAHLREQFDMSDDMFWNHLLTCDRKQRVQGTLNEGYYLLFYDTVPTNEIVDKLELWLKASIYLLAAQHNMIPYRYAYDNLTKPNNQVFIEMFQTYRNIVLNKQYLDEPHNGYMDANYQKRIDMCDTYIQRFTDNTDWVQRLLKQEYSNYRILYPNK